MISEKTRKRVTMIVAIIIGVVGFVAIGAFIFFLVALESWGSHK